MVKYEHYYNRCGMMLDHERVLFRYLPEAERFALVDEHHRRTDIITEAYAERGEIIDYHDARFREQTTDTEEAK